MDAKGYQIGLVKWFGGYNRKLDCINNFGFAESMLGENIYVHRNELQGVESLNDNDIILFIEVERKGKKAAANVHIANEDLNHLKIFFNLLRTNKENHQRFFAQLDFKKSQRQLITTKILGEMNVFEFCEMVPALYAQNEDDISFYGPDELFKKIDTFLTGKEQIAPPLPILICNKLTAKNLAFLLQSPQKQIYFKDPKVANYINKNISRFMTEISPIDLHELVRYGVVPVKYLIYHPGYLSFLFAEPDKHTTLIEAISIRLNSSFEILERFLYAIRDAPNWSKIFFHPILGLSIESILANGVKLELISNGILKENEETIFNFISSLETNLKITFLKENIDQLPATVALALQLKGLNLGKEVRETLSSGYDQVVRTIFRGEDEQLSPFAKKQILPKLEQLLKDKQLWSLAEPYIFKKHLFEKNLEFYSVYAHSDRLKTKFEFFALAELFQLLLSGNSLETTMEAFATKLWSTLGEKQIDINEEGVFRLFPQCATMGRRGLSCEAFLWLENEDDGKKYLCRGEICSNPEVLPQTGKHYWDYNIYDWFEHLGFHYSKNGDPAREDFPIKLAGYFNRLKEIIEVLECRGCSSLMVPNLEYARNIEYARYSPEQKAFVKERLTAAYRVTVFHCVSPNCPENGKDYYINHCLGFGCYTIIDSRDLRQRCRNKRYICRNCGSCCKSCAEENPVGFCPECGSALILFEKNGKRFVYCGNRQCGFKISENNLTKKFHSQKFPVRKV